MKKIWFMMLMICAVSVFTACSDDDEKTQSNPIMNCSVPTEAEIGTEVLVRGTGFDKSIAKLSLRDADNVEVNIEEPVFNASGVSFIIPMSLKAGDYTLVLSQNGVWELGKIKLTPAALPIIGLVVPEEGYIGKELSIGGNNYDAACKIYLIKADDENAKTELTVTDRSNGLVCVIPATVEAGTYNLALSQSGGEWILGEINIVKERRIKSVVVAMDYSAFGMGISEIPYYLIYNAQGQVEKVCMDEKGSDVWYNFTYSDGEISAVTGQEDAEKYYPFIFSLKDNHVTKHTDVDLNRVYSWNYNDDQLQKIIRESNSKVNLALEWQKDNAVKVGDDSFVYDEEKKVKGIDIAKCFSFLMSSFANQEIFYAELLGLAGEKSVNIVKSFVDGEEQEHAMKCTQDDKGYLTSVFIEGTEDMSFFPTTITITYE